MKLDLPSFDFLMLLASELLESFGVLVVYVYLKYFTFQILGPIYSIAFRVSSGKSLIRLSRMVLAMYCLNPASSIPG